MGALRASSGVSPASRRRAAFRAGGGPVGVAARRGSGRRWRALRAGRAARAPGWPGLRARRAHARRDRARGRVPRRGSPLLRRPAGQRGRARRGSTLRLRGFASELEASLRRFTAGLEVVAVSGRGSSSHDARPVSSFQLDQMNPITVSPSRRSDIAEIANTTTVATTRRTGPLAAAPSTSRRLANTRM